jgi:molybdate transport system substrate-binding protein
MQLNILSAGAAEGVVTALAATFKAETGAEIIGTFGAVGTMREKLLGGAPCDLIILTRAQIVELRSQSRIQADSIADLGTVRTGIALRSHDVKIDVSTAESLRAALLAAEQIFFPDPIKATAGIHFANVIASLGIQDEVQSRLRTFPNGATAMRAMVEVDAATRVIGCTQVTEINNTPGAVLIGMLPKKYELATVYSLGVSSTAASAELAGRFARMLTGEPSRALRARAGYEFSS